MSIGTVLADGDTFRPAAVKYHILPQACEIGRMYAGALLETPVRPIVCSREEAMQDLLGFRNTA